MNDQELYDSAEKRALQLWDQEALRQEMMDWKKEKDAVDSRTSIGPQLQPGMSRIRVMQWAAAASVALLLGFFFLLPRTDERALALGYFEETISDIRGAAEAPDALTQAWSAMSEKNYTGALALLPTETDGPYAETVQLLRGECHFRLGQYPAALTAYRALQQPGTSTPNRERAEWLTILTMLADGQSGEETAQSLARIVQNPAHTFHPQAVQLQKGL